MRLLAPTQALLLLLVAWAIALLLQLLRPQRRRVIVPFMPLWDALLLPEATTRLFGRLRRIGSLLIAFAISGLLVLALLDPKAAGPRLSARSCLVLVDAGQHMQARDVAPTRLAQAGRLALQLLAAKAPSDQWLVAQLDAGVTPLSTLTADVGVLRAALERLTRTDAVSDIDSGIAFALQLLEGRSAAKLVLISDGAFALSDGALDRLRERGVAFEHVSLGRATRNLGIRSFSARRYASNRTQSELLVVLENAGDQPEPVELTLSGDGSPISVTQLELAAHSLVTRTYGEIPAQAQRLEAQLVARGPLGPDALPDDDRAYAVLPTPTRTRVLLVSNGDRYLEAALLLDRAREVSVVAPSAYRGAGDHDLVVFDAFAPPEPPAVPSLYLAPPKNARDFPFRVQGVVEHPNFDGLAREHPLVHQLALRDVNISRAQRLETHADDTVVASSHGTPLIVSGQRAGQPFVALSFDIRDSDLPLRVAWPLFVAQAIDFLRKPAPDFRPSLQVGNEQRIALAHPADQVRVASPQAPGRVLGVRGQAAWLRPLSAGFYQFETATERQLWAANRPADASLSIAPKQLGSLVQRVSPVSQAFSFGDAWQLCALLAWSIAFVEWFSFQRRWTV